MGLPWLHPDEEVLCLYNILIWNIQIQRHTTMQLQKCKINKCAQRSAKQAFTAIRMGPHDSRWGGEVLRSLYWYEIYKYWYKYWYEICYTDLLIWNIQIRNDTHTDTNTDMKYTNTKIYKAKQGWCARYPSMRTDIAQISHLSSFSRNTTRKYK